jgi:hypothetical protein
VHVSIDINLQDSTWISHIKREGILACIAELLIVEGFFGTLYYSGRETQWVKAKKAA